MSNLEPMNARIHILGYDSPYVATDMEEVPEDEFVESFIEFANGDGVISPYWKSQEGMNELFIISQFVFTLKEDFVYEDN